MRSHSLFLSAWLLVGCIPMPVDDKGESGTPSEDSGRLDTEVRPGDLPRIGLHEAVTRGIATITYLNTSNGGFEIRNESDDVEVAIDGWYTMVSDLTQDAGLGDPGDREPSLTDDAAGAQVIPPGEQIAYAYAGWPEDSLDPGNRTWWCVEHNQPTDTTTQIYFNGSHVPSPLVHFMLDPTDEDGDGREDHQDGDESIQTNVNIWDFIAANPVFILGRPAGWRAMQAGAVTTLDFEVMNLGRGFGSVFVSQQVPAGFTASGFSLDPYQVDSNKDGSTTFWFAVKIIGATEQGTGPATYVTVTVSGTLEASSELAPGRYVFPAPEATWSVDGIVDLTALGSPLVVEVE